MKIIFMLYVINADQESRAKHLNRQMREENERLEEEDKKWIEGVKKEALELEKAKESEEIWGKKKRNN